MAVKKRSSEKPKSTAPSGNRANSAPGETAKDEVDAQLARYRSMRDFSTTAEPAGGSVAAAPPGGLPFVIQKHAATRLHYDFRLGWRGVLKSWACAKGPSYNTGDKRLAVQVEDHPMEYGGFEGTIPKGQYGGGTVLVWDQGTWEPLPDHDFDEGLRKGAVKFTLHGTKLEGRWTLVRMGGHAAQEAKPNWLLIKEHDGNERPAEAPLVTDDEPDSVVTGRSLEAIAAAEDHVWNSRPAETSESKSTKRPRAKDRIQERLKDARLQSTAPAATASSPAKAKASPTMPAADNGLEDGPETAPETAAKAIPPPTGKKPATKPQLPAAQSTAQSWFQGAPAEPMPAFLPPQLATAAETIPQGSGWLHELKLDGYRIQAHLRTKPNSKAGKAKSRPQREATLYTRSGLDWTHRMRAVAAALEALPVDQAVLDGELVVLDDKGQTSFSSLQAAFEKGEAATLTFFAFDLLHLDGKNLRGLPLHIRKALLEPLMARAQASSPSSQLIQFSQHLQLSATAVYAHACELGAEGILSKKMDSRYNSGRSESWLKLKCTRRQEFVIAGFTLPKDGGAGLGSLLLGFYDGTKLVHCGRCGTGFTQSSARELRRKLEPLRQAKAAYSTTLDYKARKDAIWLRPELVCEVQFATWTADGSVRHASFQGLRDDKPASEIVKEGAPPSAGIGAPENEEDQEIAAQAPPVEPEEPSTPKRKGSAAKHPAPKKEGKQSDGEAAPAARPDAPKPAPAAERSSLSPQTGSKTAIKGLTHPDKILDAASGTTKQHLAEYLLAAAPAMLPHLTGRPISIVRCPNGTEGKCFFQKHAGAGLPSSISAIPVPDKTNHDHSEDYIAVDSAEALVGLAQLGVLELHPWGSQASALERPDRLIFDLDPDESLPWSTVVESAQAIRAFLAELRLQSFVKTTGGKGLHLVVALEPTAEWPEIRLFSRGIAAAIESSDPKLYLIKMTKAARKGRIFLDWMRNERGSTAVAPWSPRARAGMRVAVPLSWDELSGGPPQFAVANFADWRARIHPNQNPWAAMRPQTLEPAVLEAVLAHSGEAKPKSSGRRR